MKQSKILGITIILIVIGIFIKGSIDQSYAISRGSGTVLTDNWWEALNWIKNNTSQCSTIATYWDPGHFITAIAERSVVFDGASQGERRTIEENGSLSEDEIKKIAVLDNYEVNKNDGKTKITTARIQDIATAFYTDNETIAAKLLEKYKNPGCNDVYFIASSDLIGKSVWWSYFATWKPGISGKQYSYAIVNLAQQKNLPDQNTKLYIYPISAQQSFIIVETNQSLKGLIQQGDKVVEVEYLAYFNENGQGKLVKSLDSSFKGLLWLDPSRNVLVFTPPEIQNSMFTRMFLFDGGGLQKFELVKNWGGEVKLFKVKL